MYDTEGKRAEAEESQPVHFFEKRSWDLQAQQPRARHSGGCQSRAVPTMPKPCHRAALAPLLLVSAALQFQYLEPQPSMHGRECTAPSVQSCHAPSPVGMRGTKRSSVGQDPCWELAPSSCRSDEWPRAEAGSLLISLSARHRGLYLPSRGFYVLAIVQSKKLRSGCRAASGQGVQPSRREIPAAPWGI